MIVEKTYYSEYVDSYGRVEYSGWQNITNRDKVYNKCDECSLIFSDVRKFSSVEELG